jgi:hypothetical protein
MGSKQSSEQDIEQKLSSVIENKCGGIQCKNVQNVTVEVGAGGDIGGVKAKQVCAAKLACAFDSLIDQKVDSDLAAKLKQGALATGDQNTKQKLRQEISSRVLNECGGVVAENVQNIFLKGGDKSKIHDIDLDQAGTAQMECGAKTLIRGGAKSKAKTDMKLDGALDWLNNLFGALGMMGIILVVGVILLLILFGPMLIKAIFG